MLFSDTNTSELQMSIIVNVMTTVNGHLTSMEDGITNPMQQKTPPLQRSYTCKQQQTFKRQRNLSVRNPKVYSTPSTPNLKVHKKLSCHSSLSRAGSVMSEDDFALSRKSSVLSLGEKITSIFNITGPVD
jgi:hypothetical protein